ncbi:cation:proton antiporter [Streptomyces sp. NPDC019224]|uniref:cation:proton antiporter domain-containing protein n=1 Tax=Streptomyces sp. NPDC019224 TaxID=3154484 RepID=UPI0033D87BDD
MQDLPRLLVALAVILVAAHLLGLIARRLGQPSVVGEIAAGILLGPSLAGGALPSTVFPPRIQPSLAAMATTGICLFMFFVGLHLDRTLLNGRARLVATVSVSSIALPFCLGMLLALRLASLHPIHNRSAFALFMGTAMSVTAFPVLARILADRGLDKTPVGALALACAALDDVLAWTLLATVVTLVESPAQQWRVLLVIPFGAALLTVLRPSLSWLADRCGTGPAASAAALLIGAAGLTACAAATDWMGLHAIFGAFLFGVITPRRGTSGLRARVQPAIEGASRVVLLPVFFLTAGLKVDLSGFDAGRLLELVLIITVAVCGKGIGAFVGARSCGVRPRYAAVLALLINTRGLTELIVLTVGLQLGLLDPDLYALMVVMALVTTTMTGALLRVVHPARRVRREAGAHPGASCATEPVPAPKK